MIGIALKDRLALTSLNEQTCLSTQGNWRMEMRKQSMLIGMAILALLPGSLAHARNDAASQGGKSPQHMSQQGRESANSPFLGQEKGDQRSAERMNQQGREQGRNGIPDSRDDKGKSKGHYKDNAQGKAKGHSK